MNTNPKIYSLGALSLVLAFNEEGTVEAALVLDNPGLIFLVNHAAVEILQDLPD